MHVYRKLSTNRTLCIWAVRQKICSRCTRVPQHFQHMRNLGSIVRATRPTLGTLLDLCKPQQTASFFMQCPGLFMPITMSSMYSCIAHANPSMLLVNSPNSHPLKLVADVSESLSAKISPWGHVDRPAMGASCMSGRTCLQAYVASNTGKRLQPPTHVAADWTKLSYTQSPKRVHFHLWVGTSVVHDCCTFVHSNFRLMQLMPVLENQALNKY